MFYLCKFYFCKAKTLYFEIFEDTDYQLMIDGTKSMFDTNNNILSSAQIALVIIQFLNIEHNTIILIVIINRINIY